MIRRLTAGVLVIALLLAGCTVGPDYRPPDLATSSQWAERPGQSGTEAGDPSYWDSFDDPALTRLIHDAIINNRDLKIVGERVIEARDELRVAASNSIPPSASAALRRAGAKVRRLNGRCRLLPATIAITSSASTPPGNSICSAARGVARRPHARVWAALSKQNAPFSSA